MIKAIFLFTLIACAFAVPQADEGKLLYTKTTRNLKQLVKAGGCEVNVCFAIDTSGSIDIDEFDLQRDFLIDMTAIIGEDKRSNFAAGQYGSKTYTITPLTNNIDDFNEKVDDAVFQNDRRTSVGSGIVWCDRQLRKQRGDVNKLVLLGDGRNNLGGSPVRRANNFRRRTDNAFVSAVGVGFDKPQELIDITKNASQVFTVDDYVELSEVIEFLVKDICGFDLVPTA